MVKSAALVELIVNVVVVVVVVVVKDVSIDDSIISFHNVSKHELDQFENLEEKRLKSPVFCVCVSFFVLISTYFYSSTGINHSISCEHQRQGRTQERRRRKKLQRQTARKRKQERHREREEKVVPIQELK